MAREIEIPKQEVIIQIKEELSLVTDKICVEKVTDDGVSVTALLSFFSHTGLTKSIILWSEDTSPSYSDVGVWSDKDVDNRIIEILKP